MKKYKYSKYNYEFVKNGIKHIYNSLTGDTLKCSIDKHWNSDEVYPISIPDEIEEKAIKFGILVPCNIEEYLEVINRFSEFENNDELFLIILPTEKCNLRCVYCYENFKKDKMSQEVQDNIIEFLERVLIHYKKLYISWFGGEPLLELKIIEDLSQKILALTDKLNIEYKAGITTNGVLLSESVFSKLVSYKIQDFQITLDGSQEVHDKQRVFLNGKGSFEIIYRNLLCIRNSSENFGAIVRTNIGERQPISIYKFIDKFKEDFANDSRFMLHFVAIKDLTGTTHQSVDLCDTYSLFKYYNYARNKGIKFDFYKYMYKPTKMICYAANPNSLVIGSDGLVYKCTVAFDLKENIIGKIQNGEVNLNFAKHKMWVNNGFENSNKCCDCKFVPVCYGKFCPLEKIINKKEPCPPFSTYIQRYLEVLT